MTTESSSHSSEKPLLIDDRAQGVFRISHTAYTDPHILERERQEIFDRSWLYAGHESEIAKPGDYLTRKIGGRATVIVRDNDGSVRVLLNSCPHRGNRVCRERSGNAKRFICFYHAWSFRLDGAPLGIPGDEAYAPGLDRAALSMAPVPRTGIYRGLIFISYDPDIVSLESYLGNARKYIDLMLDFAGEDLEIVPGQQAYSMRANWKLLIENSIDVYHAQSTHNRYFSRFLPDMGLDPRLWMNLSDSAPGAGYALDNGHSVVEGPIRSGPLAKTAAAELAEARRKLEQKFGLERAAEIADFSRNLFIFPNLILISTWRTIRTFYPIAPDYMEIDAWALLPRDEPARLRQARMDNFISFLGPAGFGTPDDVSGLEGCQRGFAQLPAQTRATDMSRGMGRRPISTDELQMRAFWRRWHALMNGETFPTNTSDRDETRAVAE